MGFRCHLHWATRVAWWVLHCSIYLTLPRRFTIKHNSTLGHGKAFDMSVLLPSYNWTGTSSYGDYIRQISRASSTSLLQWPDSRDSRLLLQSPYFPKQPSSPKKCEQSKVQSLAEGYPHRFHSPACRIDSVKFSKEPFKLHLWPSLTTLLFCQQLGHFGCFASVKCFKNCRIT